VPPCPLAAAAVAPLEARGDGGGGDGAWGLGGCAPAGPEKRWAWAGAGVPACSRPAARSADCAGVMAAAGGGDAGPPTRAGAPVGRSALKHGN
jgi:hypothetical protein